MSFPDDKQVLQNMDKHIEQSVQSVYSIYRSLHNTMGVSYEYIIKSRMDWQHFFISFTISDPEYLNIPSFYEYYRDIYKDKFTDAMYRKLELKVKRVEE